MTVFQILSLTVVIFLRVSGCLMILPGFSGERIPILLRLYLSLAISVFSCPIVGSEIIWSPSHLGNSLITMIIIHELIIGLFIGFLCRMFIMAIETIATSFCYTIGLSNIFDVGAIDSHSSPALTSFIIITIIQLIFITDHHLDFIEGIVSSFKIIPIGAKPDYYILMNDLSNSISQAFFVSSRISSPLILFSIIINLTFAFFARLSPNIPVYFVSGPCVILLGFIFFNFYSLDYFSSLISSFREIIRRS